MRSITIEGLTQEQCVMADWFWLCKTSEQVDRLIASLPTEGLQDQARNVLELMILAMEDELVEDLTLANELIKKASR